MANQLKLGTLGAFPIQSHSQFGQMRSGSHPNRCIGDGIKPTLPSQFTHDPIGIEPTSFFLLSKGKRHLDGLLRPFQLIPDLSLTAMKGRHRTKRGPFGEVSPGTVGYTALPLRIMEKLFVSKTSEGAIQRPTTSGAWAVNLDTMAQVAAASRRGSSFWSSSLWCQSA